MVATRSSAGAGAGASAGASAPPDAPQNSPSSPNKWHKRPLPHHDLTDHDPSSPTASQISLPEQNQCILCNQQQPQLLACSITACGLTMHQTCILITPTTFDKDGCFYCPSCAFTRAENFFSLARESMSSFLEMRKIPNQQNCQEVKQPVKQNINAKRKGKKAQSSDDRTTQDEVGDANLAAFPTSPSCEQFSLKRQQKTSEIKMVLRERKGKHVRYNDSRNMIHGKEGKEDKKQEVDLASARVDDIGVKSGPGATSRGHVAVSMDGTENERTEERVNADAKRRLRYKPRPSSSNKVAAPQRRKILPWTKEEEQALRDGMQKSGVTHDGRIPWSAILEFGGDVFHKTRSTIDLKDKWRNMMKKEMKREGSVSI